jgi:hypothetical protein
VAETALTFEYRPSLRGQTIVAAKLGEEVVYTDKLDISRADQREKFVRALCKGRRGIARYRKEAVVELDRIAAEIASPASAEKEGGGNSQQHQQFIPYTRTPEGLFRIKRFDGEDILIPLTNFDAKIVADIVHDDGTESQNAFEIQARLGEEVQRFSVPASSFASLNWAIEHLGSRAIVYAGSTVRDHARVAIQMLSGERDRRTIHTHMGWRKIGGQWVYLHAAGGIGAGGTLANVLVNLGDGLTPYRLPNPPQGEQLREAIAATLRRLDLSPAPVSIPIFIAPFRAAMGLCDFTLHLAGTTGVFKTELAALMNQHFGPGIDGRHLPGSWHGTENALEGLAFTAKDALLVIDDFAPAGPPHEVQRWHQKADRIIRHQGNNNARQRMRADGSLRPPKPPRGMIVSTGEEVPRGQSLRARMLIIEIDQDDIDVVRLSACQADAAKGLYASAMAGFVQWLGARYEDVQKNLRAQINELRQQATVSGMHRRTPDIVASLTVGLEYFLAFAQDAGATAAGEAKALRQRGWLALGQVAAKQDAYHKASEPTRRFIELLLSGIASGHAHVAGLDGRQPDDTPEAWGWRLKTIGNSLNERDEWQPQGDRVGWVDCDTVYLDPDASYRSAQAMAAGSADGLGITTQTLRKRLHERGLLVVEGSRQALTVRKVLEGRTRNVLQIRAGALMPKTPDIPDIPDGAADGQRQQCQESQVLPAVDPQDRQSEVGAATPADRPNDNTLFHAELQPSEDGLDGMDGVAPTFSEAEVEFSDEVIL